MKKLAILLLGAGLCSCNFLGQDGRGTTADDFDPAGQVKTVEVKQYDNDELTNTTCYTFYYAAGKLSMIETLVSDATYRTTYKYAPIAMSYNDERRYAEYECVLDRMGRLTEVGDRWKLDYSSGYLTRIRTLLDESNDIRDMFTEFGRDERHHGITSFRSFVQWKNGAEQDYISEKLEYSSTYYGNWFKDLIVDPVFTLLIYNSLGNLLFANDGSRGDYLPSSITRYDDVGGINSKSVFWYSILRETGEVEGCEVNTDFRGVSGGGAKRRQVITIEYYQPTPAQE